MKQFFEKDKRRRPKFFKLRSSGLFTILAVGFALFTDLVIYTIIVPIMPFAINAMQQGYSPRSIDSSNIAELTTKGIDNPGEVSRITGLLLTLYGVGLIIGSPIAGYFGDQVKGRKLPMLVGVLVFFCSMFMFLYGTQLWVFGVARFLQGVANSIVWIYGVCLIIDNFPENVLGKMLSLVFAANSIGLATGAPVGALFYRFGYQAPFLFCISLTVLDFLLRLLIIERRDSPKEWFISDDHVSENMAAEENQTSTAPPPQQKNVAAERSSSNNIKEEGVITMASEDPIYDNDRIDIDVENGASNKNSCISIIQILKYPRFLASSFLCLVYGIIFNVFEPTLPIHLANEWDFNPSQIGLVLLAQTVLTSIATPIGGAVYDRYGPKWLSFGTMVFCSIFVALMSIPSRSTAGGVAPLIVTLAVEGALAVVFVVPSMPEIAHAISQLANENGVSNSYGHATGYGLYNGCFGIGTLCGPLLGGYLFKSLGFFWMCIIVACIVLLSAPIVLIYSGEKIGIGMNGGISRFLNRKNKESQNINII